MTDLLAEVDDMMRQERMEKFWQENKKTIMGAIAGLIILTALLSFYRSWDENVRARNTGQLLNLIESPAFPDNIASGIDNMRSNPRAMAKLIAARTYLDQDKKEEALALYRDVARDRSSDRDLYGLGILMEARLMEEQGASEDVLKNLKTLYNDKGGLWRAPAAIEAAVIMAHQKNDYAGAQELLEIVGEEKNLPPALYNRAKALQHVYVLKEKTGETP